MLTRSVSVKTHVTLHRWGRSPRMFFIKNELLLNNFLILNYLFVTSWYILRFQQCSEFIKYFFTQDLKVSLKHKSINLSNCPMKSKEHILTLHTKYFQNELIINQSCFQPYPQKTTIPHLCNRETRKFCIEVDVK